MKQVIFALVTLALTSGFLLTGFIPREKDNLDNFVQLQEWAVQCEVDGMPFYAHYVSEEPRSLTYEIDLCNHLSTQFN